MSNTITNKTKVSTQRKGDGVCEVHNMTHACLFLKNITGERLGALAARAPLRVRGLASGEQPPAHAVVRGARAVHLLQDPPGLEVPEAGFEKSSATKCLD